ncbi:hypothetical protein CYMTET_55959 [Cymbomonas tetramitiformis]|uniref:Major facilitator superfamily (MFS) profile domain-containing protein n=1 Tax=Cymbomonas tetramitiformis TaxID=36881 RepID=A0AAE0BC95_9CHLO|nr:hypothetical protein CYMTET_55959 [Cymbomonas tetramitiformis]
MPVATAAAKGVARPLGVASRHWLQRARAPPLRKALEATCRSKHRAFFIKSRNFTEFTCPGRSSSSRNQGRSTLRQLKCKAADGEEREEKREEEPEEEVPSKLPKWARAVSNATDDQNKALWGVSVMTFLYGASVFMVASLLPVYLKRVVGMSQTNIGYIEGIAISMSFFARGFSGVASDLFKSRFPPIIIGGLLQCCVKPIAVMSTSVTMLASARLLDRFAKGIRAAPTDALLADLSPTGQQGSVYGMYHSSSTLGSMVGGTLAMIIMWATCNNYRAVFALSTIPAVLAILIPILVIKEPKLGKLGKRLEHIKSEIKEIDAFMDEIQAEQTASISEQEEKPACRKQIQRAKRKKELLQLEGGDRFTLRFYKVMAIAWILYTARFSEAFITLRAVEVGLPVALVPILLVVSQVLQTALSYPLGRWADEFLDRNAVLVIGFFCLAAANIACFQATGPLGMILGVFFQGLHMSAAEGNLKALVAQSLPLHLRGTGFSIFAMSAGTAVVVGNMTAGYLADYTVSLGLGSVGPFYAGLASTLLATVALLVMYNSDSAENRGKLLPVRNFLLMDKIYHM